MSDSTTAQAVRAPHRWTEVVVIDSYPIYAPHFLVSRYDGVPTWDIARVLNLVASTIAHGRAFDVAQCEKFSTIARDCATSRWSNRRCARMTRRVQKSPPFRRQSTRWWTCNACAPRAAPAAGTPPLHRRCTPEPRTQDGSPPAQLPQP